MNHPNLSSSGPQIARHHDNDPWRPQQLWPSSAYVQWGRGGVVFVRNGESYTTAFFEVFPRDDSAGFIRGEGTSLEEAEAQSFKDWQKYSSCATRGHLWSRNRSRNPVKPNLYLNGGCFCLRCGSFQTAMKPVIKLGEWREPLEKLSLQSIAMGFLRSQPDLDEKDAKHRQYKRKLSLRASLAGIKLPPDPGPKTSFFEDDEYSQKCRQAVRDYIIENNNRIKGEQGFFGVMSQEFLARLLDEI